MLVQAFTSHIKLVRFGDDSGDLHCSRLRTLSLFQLRITGEKCENLVENLAAVPVQLNSVACCPTQPSPTIEELWKCIIIVMKLFDIVYGEEIEKGYYPP
jgi:hypothetical protein